MKNRLGPDRYECVVGESIVKVSKFRVPSPMFERHLVILGHLYVICVSSSMA